MSALMQDLTFSWRMMRKAPAFTAVAVTTLALALGANTAILSLAEALFRQTIPGADASRLVGIYLTHQGRIREAMGFTHGNYQQIRDGATTVSPVAAHYSGAPLTIAWGDGSRDVLGAVVSAEFFSLLGVRPAVGRFFDAAETRPNAPAAVVVLSFDAWQNWFAGQSVVGRTLAINGTIFTIVGVAPSGFRGALLERSNDAWIPMSMLGVGYRPCKQPFAPTCGALSLIGRLAPGRDIREARAELATIAPRLERDLGQDGNDAVGLETRELRGVGEGAQRGEQARIVTLLLASASLLLLVACANLAGTLLARGVARQRDIAIRRAMGAAPSRIVRQLATEGVVMALLGAAAGLLVAVWMQAGLETLYSLDASGYGRRHDLRLEPTVLGLSALLAVAAGVAFGGGPALQAARVDLTPALKGDPLRVGRSKLRAKDLLLAAQVALACLGVVTAMMLVASLRTVRGGGEVDVGRVALLRMRPAQVGYDTSKARPHLREVVRRLEAQPGVRSVTFVGSWSVWDDGLTARVSRPDDAHPSIGAQPETRRRPVGPRFFGTLGIPLVAGRDFDDSDDARAPLVAIVNHTLARALWPDGSPIGRSLIVNGRTMRVVGVGGDVGLVKTGELRPPMVYTAFWQDTSARDSRVAVQLSGDPAVALAGLERAARAVDPSVPITEVMSLQRQIDGSFVSIRLAVTAVSYAAALAIVLSALGMYGALAFAVTTRTREIAVRVALGARQADVVGVVYGDSVRVVAAGVAVGLLASLAASRLLASFLYGTGPASAVLFTGAAGLLVIVSIVAASMPLRRALRIEPRAALQV